MSFTFFKNFVRRPSQIGAIAPSSRCLADEMVRWFEWDRIRNVVEYGPGTGVFTSAIREQLRPDANFFVIERSSELCQILREKYSDLDVCEDSVANVRSQCAARGITQVDAVICGLPWASFPEVLQDSCLESMAAVLAPEAQFATFAYWQGLLLPAARRFRRKLNCHFNDIQASPTVWWNLPPAFIYRCRNR
jgi:phosphatidylethanolamine/phosphatidyl-N-methylethanolamine N-methyltransferase